MDITITKKERRMGALYRFPLTLSSYDYRAVCFFTACVIYAVFGSPTPDRLSFTEVLTGLLLLLSVGIGRARDVILNQGKEPSVRVRFWQSAGRVYLLYGLCIPLFIGVLSGHGLSIIVRDIIPFLFLFLPLFLLPLVRVRPYYFRGCVAAVLLIGMMFSLRSVMMRYGQDCAIWCSEELLYLENMPTVLFTALFLIGTGMSVLMRGSHPSRVIISTALMVFALAPLAAMVLTLQRASLGAAALYIAALLSFFIIKRPIRAVFVVGFMGTILVLAGVSLYGVYAPLWDKTVKVGFNMRSEEFSAVWDVVSQSPVAFLFGLGWGGQFHSPAVGNLQVNFTHNFFSTVLLKTGALGVIFCISYIAGILEHLVRVILTNKVLGLALAAPVLIDLTLYASFKSLDFGLMLLLISASLIYFKESKSESVMS